MRLSQPKRREKRVSIKIPSTVGTSSQALAVSATSGSSVKTGRMSSP